MPSYQNYYPSNQQQMYQGMGYQQNPYSQNIFNPYQNQQNYQFQQQSNIQQPMIQQNNSLIGRFVDDFSTITANDVPMQNPATFIKNDGSEIQIRGWNASGTISTTVYKPVVSGQDDNAENKSMNSLDVLNEDMRAFRDEINARFDKLEKSIGGNSRGRAKKEVEVNQDESI